MLFLLIFSVHIFSVQESAIQCECVRISWFIYIVYVVNVFALFKTLFRCVLSFRWFGWFLFYICNCPLFFCGMSLRLTVIFFLIFLFVLCYSFIAHSLLKWTVQKKEKTHWFCIDIRRWCGGQEESMTKKELIALIKRD